ncbi:MAG: hypothetical protein PSV23_11820 [Brevundimonas sp.]|uniref:hypothetical protein n=1 Tax=Brevundimonas sp. TaxID=1871086 RepID=UPI0024885CE0|nr:hypothetical protein [Brevundimonas sp.]MDI1327472.1 hypothetical protein [Brevundimonas sp.]
MLRFLTLAVTVLICAGDARAQPAVQDHVGDVYELRLKNTTESSTDDGSSGSSQSGGLLVERVVAVRDDGVELEFDLPPEATAEDRAGDWQWPARVLKSPDGSLHLLNAAELETRIDAWLVAGGMPREACGHWIFTWNAFKIECDPHSVIGTLAPFDLRIGDLRDGASYAERGGLGPVLLRMRPADAGGSAFVAETPINPEFVRRERAESDVVVAEIMGEPKTLDDALQARAADDVTGEITTTFTTDAGGRVVRRTTVTTLTTTDAEGVVERSTSTRTVEGRLLDPSKP